jgi:tRNA(Ile)-lysidine synthase
LAADIVGSSAPSGLTALGGAEFAAWLETLGPFGRPPHLGLAVSGGADSLALAALTAEWMAPRGGALAAFVVDHGLRPEASAEAETAILTLSGLGIPARILRPGGLEPGPGLPARARAARYAALQAACRACGILDLLLGHHAGDQAETLLMRRASGSGPAGLAGMGASVQIGDIRLLRPLLAVAPGRLRLTLCERGIEWAEDPTNTDPHYLRPRLRAMRADPEGAGAETLELCEAALAAGSLRRAEEMRTAHWLASHATIRREGFAILPAGPWPARALAALLRVCGGRHHAPPPQHVAALAAAPRPACLGGARLVPAGRMGSGFLVLREAAAMAPPVAATAGAAWDHRFRRIAEDAALPGATIGALGVDAPCFRHLSELPSVLLATLPAFRHEEAVVAVPALGWSDAPAPHGRRLVFAPAQPVAGAAFRHAMI